MKPITVVNYVLIGKVTLIQLYEQFLKLCDWQVALFPRANKKGQKQTEIQYQQTLTAVS